MTGVSFTIPSYDLESIQQALNSVSKLRMTMSARKGAISLGLDDQDIIDAIQSIDHRDFYKTMPSNNPIFPYQDVYKFHWQALAIYAKFQNVNGYFVLSFKVNNGI